MPTTSNFGWTTPADTDLVKDGAAAIRTLGDGIDTSLVDLKGGTTDQVLAKNSNTDMDFKWVTSDDANAIQNAIVDAKGDLIAASAADTPARLAVGNNGETLVADSSATTGLRWQSNYSAGKNKIINGDFGIWQRGTSFSLTSTDAYTADRFIVNTGGSGVCSVTRETFTAGQTDVPNAVYFLQANYTTSGSSSTLIRHKIEDVNTLAGQTATFSFYAKVSSGTKSITPRLNQDFGSGGSATVVTNLTAQTLTTSWQRFSITATIPSVSGKTIGTSSFLMLDFDGGTTGVLTYSWANFQLEAGSVATPFTTATGTLAGELAACQRYYQRINAAQSFYRFAIGTNVSATQSAFVIPFRTSMRTTPTFAASGNFDTVEGVTSRGTNAPTLSSDGNNTDSACLFTVIASGTSAAGVQLRSNSSTASYIEFSSEL